MPSAWVSLPGPVAQVDVALERRAARASASTPVERLERADQHGGADALALAHGVEQRVDPVGAVDVGRARRRRRASRSARVRPDVGVAGRLGVVVGLGLDDHAPRCRRGAPRSRPGRARPRGPGGRRRRRQGSRQRAAQRGSSCSRTRASAVPPSATLDSSHEDCASTAAASSPSARAPATPRRSGQRFLLDRVAHQPGDHAVRLAERRAAADEQVGEVGRGDQLVGGGGRHRARGRSAPRRSCPRAARRPARACRPRRRGAPCPPGGPCCRSAAARAARRAARPGGRRSAAPWRAAARRRRGSSSGA